MMVVFWGTEASIVDFLSFCRQESSHSAVFFTNLLDSVAFICKTIELFDKTMSKLTLESIINKLARCVSEKEH